MSEQSQVTITIRENGPYRVDGPVKLMDANGNEIPVERLPLALCRCGGSMTKPFCDRTHSKIGFQGAMAAVEQSDPKNPG